MGRQGMKLFPDWYQDYTTVAGVIGMGVGVVMLAAGLATLRRRPSGRVLHLVYAALTCIQIAVGLVVLIMAIPEVQASGSSDPAARAGLVGGLIGDILGTIFGAVYPVFILIWFSRRKIRDEVAKWA